ncbi:MAG: hypothetical protein JNG88_15090 [Phycisphaerales bacterium]|nr:hypothetical protein [Phycisphaerales bacterium]
MKAVAAPKPAAPPRPSIPGITTGGPSGPPQTTPANFLPPLSPEDQGDDDGGRGDDPFGDDDGEESGGWDDE